MSNKTDNSNTPSSYEILVTPGEHDMSKLVFHDPHTSTFTVGEGAIDNTMSYAFYLNDEGQECKLFFPGPPQNCFGVEYQYEFSTADSDKNPSNAKALQVSYPLTSLASVANPKPEEQAFISFIEDIWNSALEVGKQEILREELKIPEVSYNSFVAAEKRGLWANALKRPMEYPTIKNDKSKKGGLDKTKPMRMYIKLLTKGRGDKLRVDTPFYGPGDKLESAIKYIKKQGVITPCLWFEGIYWGAHGRNPQGASLRFKLVEANYVPIKNLNAPSHRMLGKNTAPPQEEDDFDTNDEVHNPRNKMFNRYGDDDDADDNADFEAPGKKGNPISDVKKPTAKAKAVIKKPAPKVATDTKPVAKAKAVVKKPVAKAKSTTPVKPQTKTAATLKPKPKSKTTEHIEEWADIEVDDEENVDFDGEEDVGNDE